MISFCGHLERNNDFFINYLIISPFNLIEYYSSLLKSPQTLIHVINKTITIEKSIYKSKTKKYILVLSCFRRWHEYGLEG